jgi:hypothetical protein
MSIGAEDAVIIEVLVTRGVVLGETTGRRVASYAETADMLGLKGVA